MSEIDKKEIERRFKEISQYELRPEVVSRDLDRTKECLTKLTSKYETQNRQTRKFVIKSRITKLVAAAVIIVAALSGLYLFDTEAPAYGITEAFEMWKNSGTVHIKGWSYLHTGDDTQLEKFPFEHWFDKPNGRFKHWWPAGWFGDYTTETPRYYLRVSDGQYIMETYCGNKADDNAVYSGVRYKKLSPFQQRLQIRTMEPFPSYMTNIEKVKDFVRVGRDRINDKTIDIWQGEITAAGKKIPYMKMKIWISNETGRIVRMFIWRNVEDDSIRWVPSRDVDMIEYYVIPPVNCFITDPPEGYELDNTKETTVARELGDDGRVRFYDCIGFTLKDGSVVYGWHANHKPDESQAHLFTGLESGGPLPELPAQIIELKPWPLEEDITLAGRHLTFTSKKGKFYEWGIYVTDSKMPGRDTFKDYKVISKYNHTEPRSFGGRPNLVGQELTINSEQEFNTWIRGAMAELSDDGKAPEYVTYQKALELAERIRSKMSKKQSIE